MKRILILIACFVLMLLLIVFALKSDIISGRSDDSLDGESTTEAGTAESETEIEFYRSDVEVFEIETPYVNLYYPEKWAECVEIHSDGTEESYEVNFFAFLDEKMVSMYTIAFGECGNDGILGTIDCNGEEVKVYLFSYSDDYDGSEILVLGRNQKDICRLVKTGKYADAKNPIFVYVDVILFGFTITL